MATTEKSTFAPGKTVCVSGCWRITGIDACTVRVALELTVPPNALLIATEYFPATADWMLVKKIELFVAPLMMFVLFSHH
jgi:hypothetical protein